MRHLPLSRMLLGLCMRAARNRLLFTDNLIDFIEYSCGVAQITLALCMAGLVGAAFDKQHSAGQNCLLSEGLALWINAITMTKPGSLQWFGTQCSSFVPVCANNHKRCPDNYYLGDTSRAFVRDGNTQMATHKWPLPDPSVSHLLGFLLLGIQHARNATCSECEPFLNMHRFNMGVVLKTWKSNLACMTRVWQRLPRTFCRKRNSISYNIVKAMFDQSS